MKYNIVNNSSFKITTLKKIVSFTARGFGPYLTNLKEIEFRDEWAEDDDKDQKSSGYGGWFWDNKIRVVVNPKIVYPVVIESNYSPKTKYIDGLYIRSRFELAAAIYAHEQYHACQSSLKNPIVVSNILQFDEESFADIFSFFILNKWRRKQREKLKK